MADDYFYVCNMQYNFFFILKIQTTKRKKENKQPVLESEVPNPSTFPHIYLDIYF